MRLALVLVLSLAVSGCAIVRKDKEEPVESPASRGRAEPVLKPSDVLAKRSDSHQRAGDDRELVVGRLDLGPGRHVSKDVFVVIAETFAVHRKVIEHLSHIVRRVICRHEHKCQVESARRIPSLVTDANLNVVSGFTFVKRCDFQHINRRGVLQRACGGDCIFRKSHDPCIAAAVQEKLADCVTHF